MDSSLNNNSDQRQRQFNNRHDQFFQLQCREPDPQGTASLLLQVPDPQERDSLLQGPNLQERDSLHLRVPNLLAKDSLLQQEQDPQETEWQHLLLQGPLATSSAASLLL